jgi:hypothetical protein
MSASRVTPRDRFRKRTQDCPVCGGNADHAHGQGTRCYGNLSEDGRYAFCTREDHAGALAPNANGSYRHWLGEGACRCGRTHEAPPQLLYASRPGPAPTLVKKGPSAPPKPINRPTQLHHGELGPPVRVFEARRADGALLALHCRFEWPEEGKAKPAKTLRWWRTGWSLDDLAIEDIPLYNLPALAAAPADVPVWLVEGEMAQTALQEALTAARFSAVVLATYGATALPSDAQLEMLVGHTVILWPDPDPDDQRWCDILTEKLNALGISVRVCVWPDAPRKGDAVEYVASGGTAADLAALTSPASPAKTADAAGSIEAPPAPDEPRDIKVERDLRVMAEQTAARLRKQDAWDAKLRANANLRPVYKPTLELLRDEWVRVARPAGQPMPIYREALAKKLGVEPNTVGTHLKNLAKAGIIVKKPTHTYDANGLKRTHLAIVLPEETLAHPEGLAMLGWGGKRVQYCQNIECGSTDLEVHTTVTCRNCGTVQRDERYPLNDANLVHTGNDVEQAGGTAPAQENCPGPQVDVRGIQKIQTGLFSESREASPGACGEVTEESSA